MHSIMIFSSIILSICIVNAHYAFPKEFKFGVSTSAYQTEGAWNIDGKGPSFWDYATHDLHMAQNETGDIACDSYHKYKEDVQLIKRLGVDFYRFSISWPRILPTGVITNINPEGIRYYNSLINEVLKHNITPMVTLYHWDLPLTLLGNDSEVVFHKYFPAYAELAYKLFGDRVKHWFTFNEPNNACIMLTLKDKTFRRFYECTKSLLLAHARAYNIYKRKYKKVHGGKVTMVIDSYWYEPGSQKVEDIAAASRYMDFKFGIWTHPIYFGDYPEIVKTYVSDLSAKQGLHTSRLPVLSKKEIAEIKGSHDWFAFNHYSTYLVVQNNASIVSNSNISNDAAVTSWQPSDWIGPTQYSTQIKKIPWGFRKCLNYIKVNLNNPEIIITENGYSDNGELIDVDRMDYLKKYLMALLDAVYDDHVNVIGYSAWSLMDNFEWIEGYKSKFGLYHVDFNDPNRRRTAKASAKYYTRIVKTKHLL